MRLAYDDNLGLPAAIASSWAIESTAFHDVGRMLGAFERGDVDACFAPAGIIGSLAGIGHTLIAQGTARGSTTLASKLVVRADAPEVTLDILATSAIGFINEYCTTSYWAPMITLIEEVPAGGALPFRACTGFDDLLAAVVEGRVDVGMVWDRVLARHPAEAVRTRAVAVDADLPGPLVYARGDLSAAEARVLRRTFLDARVEGAASFFDGFAEPDDECVSHFARRMAAVRSHYKLGSRARLVPQRQRVARS
jgi:ABC-type phosphate/phosphonate transport system substrate-binding protein